MNHAEKYIYAGEQIPISKLDPQTNPDHLKDIKTLYGLVLERKTNEISDEFRIRKQAAFKYLKAIDTGLVFCCAVKFGAKLQREPET